MDLTQVSELLLQSLEHERGGVKIYKAAIECTLRADLRAEWTNYLSQTQTHVDALTEICEVFGLDPFTTTPGTMIVRANGNALLQAIEAARAAGNPAAARRHWRPWRWWVLASVLHARVSACGRTGGSCGS